jgi:hypothetical protein
MGMSWTASSHSGFGDRLTSTPLPSTGRARTAEAFRSRTASQQRMEVVTRTMRMVTSPASDFKRRGNVHVDNRRHSSGERAEPQNGSLREHTGFVARQWLPVIEEHHDGPTPPTELDELIRTACTIEPDPQRLLE